MSVCALGLRVVGLTVREFVRWSVDLFLLGLLVEGNKKKAKKIKREKGKELRQPDIGS